MEEKISTYIVYNLLKFPSFVNKEHSLDEFHYQVQIFVINITKCFFIYLISLIFGIITHTFFCHLGFIIIRKNALGWHAEKSANCSILSLLFFVILPISLKKIYLNPFAISLILSILLILIVIYAPSDTEKNPLVQTKQRQILKQKTILSFILLNFSYFFIDKTQFFMILYGQLLAVLHITPIFYKISRKEFKNYEKYESY